MNTVAITISNIQPPHSVTDRAKLKALVAAMKTTGWQGRPLLVLETAGYYTAITGSHRLAAAKKAGLKTIPCVEVNSEAFYGAEYEPKDMWDDDVRLSILNEIGDTDAAALMQAEIDANEAEVN